MQNKEMDCAAVENVEPADVVWKMQEWFLCSFCAFSTHS